MDNKTLQTHNSWQSLQFTSQEQREHIKQQLTRVQPSTYRRPRSVSFWYNGTRVLVVIACVASVSVRFGSKTPQAKYRKSRSRSFFAPKPDRNACYPGYRCDLGHVSPIQLRCHKRLQLTSWALYDIGLTLSGKHQVFSCIPALLVTNLLQFN